jgi:hypothetical protein
LRGSGSRPPSPVTPLGDLCAITTSNVQQESTDEIDMARAAEFADNLAKLEAEKWTLLGCVADETDKRVEHSAQLKVR